MIIMISIIQMKNQLDNISLISVAIIMVKRRTKTQKIKCQATFENINKWLDHKLTHFGYIILAKKNNHTDKIVAYKKSTERLKKCIEEKIKITNDTDKKTDLEIMHRSVCCIQDHIIKCF
jgi:hypothetical protein